MNTLKQNIENVFGEQGRQWLASLPQIVNELAKYWRLDSIVPVGNMTFNYVAKAIMHDNQPVILKISCDANSILNEIQALKYFDGNGSVQLIAQNEKFHALLLQQAIPGVTLKSLYPSQSEYVMDSYIETMNKLHNKTLLNHKTYPHISDWLMAVDHFDNEIIPAKLIRNAISLKTKLLATMTNVVFLHGDLHHDNILKEGDQWVAIDPKGIVGEPEFEIAAFDFMYVHELANISNIKNILEERINQLAHKAHLNPQRIKDWVFVRLVLMAVWQVEDSSDSSDAVMLAEALLPA